MINKRSLSIIMMMCIICAVLMPLEDAYAETAGEKQSSFEYKQYKDQEQYKKALDQKMHRVYSVIGDADVVMYDSEGFMLRQDDDSGETVSGNPNDFALGFHAVKGEMYRICVDGKFTQCTVNIQEYKGDGTAPDPEEVAE